MIGFNGAAHSGQNGRAQENHIPVLGQNDSHIHSAGKAPKVSKKIVYFLRKTFLGERIMRAICRDRFGFLFFQTVAGLLGNLVPNAKSMSSDLEEGRAYELGSPMSDTA